MELMLEETTQHGGDGDKYWQRSFDILESIRLVQRLEARGREFKVRCGLELYRAKLSLNHGAWYPYLYKVGLEPSTSQRRIKMARDFMCWASILKPTEKVEHAHVLQAMELVYSKSCNLQDFSTEVNPDKFIAEQPNP